MTSAITRAILGGAMTVAIAATMAARPASLHAADQTILGRGFAVTDPDPGGDPARRKVTVSAKETSSPNTIVGDPIASGMTLDVVVGGAHPSAQSFVLPPGPGGSGTAGWTAQGSPPSAYVYRDPSGTNGPVHTAVLKRSSNGQFVLKAIVLGRQGPGAQPRIELVPPAPGTDAEVAFTIGDGDRYCVAFGGAAGGHVVNSPTNGAAPGSKAFKVMRPTSEGPCPTPPTTTSTTVTTTTSSSTTTAPLCGNGVLDGGEGCDPPGSLTCPPSSPGGSFTACGASCLCPGGSTITSTTSTSSSTTTSSSVTSTTSQTPTTSTTSTSRTTTTSTSRTTTSSTSSSTTTTPSGSTTTTTIVGACPSRLSFTTTAGTTTCGGAAFTPVAAAPFSGAIYNATAGGTKLNDLGLGCLYVGGGGNTATAPNANPDGPTSTFGVASCTGNTLNLVGNAAAGPSTCTLGPFATKHCTRTPAQSCTSDTECGGTGLCNNDARCFFGPPLPVPAGATSTCIVNVFSADGGGTIDQGAGTSGITIPLSSRVYLTGNNKVCMNGAPGTDGFGLCTSDSNCNNVTGACQTATACPRCIANTCIGGQQHGMTGCTPVGSKQTTLECMPKDTQFVAPLGVSLSPLGTSTSTLTSDATGKFCGASQRTAGAFGKSAARRIEETGSPAGSLTDGGSHPVTIAATFCIPATGNALIDGSTGADLPGPGAVSIRGTVQTLP